MVQIEVYSSEYKNGLVPFYKAKHRKAVSKDKVSILAYAFVRKGIISKEEWADSQQLIADKLGVEIREFPMDGRKKAAKTLPFFSWYNCALLAHNNFKSEGLKFIDIKYLSNEYGNKEKSYAGRRNNVFRGFQL